MRQRGSWFLIFISCYEIAIKWVHRL